MNWDYLAGFTDGEGSIGIVGRGIRITWGQKDKPMLVAVRDFLISQGYHPNFYSVPPRPPKRVNLFYMLNLARRDEVMRFTLEIEPRLILKVSQCLVVRAWINEHPLQKNTSPLDDKLIKRLIADGFVTTSIAKICRCGRRKVAYRLKELGLKQNRGKLYEDDQGYSKRLAAISKGINYNRQKGKYDARIYVNRKQKYLGRYKTEEEAIEAVRLGRIKYGQ